MTLWTDYYDKDKLISAFSSADPDTIAAMLSIKGIISKEDEAQIRAFIPSEKATLLITAITRQINSSPEKFRDLLNALLKANLSLPDDIVKTLKLWSDYYDKDMLTSAFSSADLNIITAMLSIKGVISKEDEAQIRASTPSETATLLVTAIKYQIKSSPEKFPDFLNALLMANLSLPDDIVETLKLWSAYCDKDILTSAFSSADPNTIAAVLSIKGILSKESEAKIRASTSSEKAKLLATAIKRRMESSPEKFRDFLNAIRKANLSLPDDIVETLWSDYYDKDKLTSAFSSADPNTIAAMLSIKGVISKKDEAKSV